MNYGTFYHFITIRMWQENVQYSSGKKYFMTKYFPCFLYFLLEYMFLYVSTFITDFNEYSNHHFVHCYKWFSNYISVSKYLMNLVVSLLIKNYFFLLMYCEVPSWKSIARIKKKNPSLWIFLNRNWSYLKKCLLLWTE